MAFSYKPPKFTVVERPVAEPSDSPQAAADFLSLVRRRVYDTTAADDNQQVGLTINSLELDKIRFQCGHSTDLLSPSAQALVREAEPYALCPKCLQEEVSEQINWPVFTFIDEPNYFVGDSREATRAQARYFVSMLHLHYDLQREESQQLIRRMNEIETKQFELVLWQALTCCQIDWWLANSRDITLLDGAIQFLHHCSSVLYLAELEPRHAALMMGLLTSEEYWALERTFGEAVMEEKGLLTYRSFL